MIRRRCLTITMMMLVLVLGVLMIMPEPTISHHTELCPICPAHTVRLNGSCLEFVEKDASWNNAGRNCQERNEKLASLSQAILDYVKTIDGSIWWVGGLGSGGDICLGVGSSGVSTYPCDTTHWFICDVEAIPITATTISTQTTLSPTTAATTATTTDSINCDQCGIKNRRKRIVGGEEVNPHRKYPWMVSILDKSGATHCCGGSIINNRWILTAKYCIDYCGLKVRVGEHDFSKTTDDAPRNTKTYTMRRSVTHRDGFDIALFELATEIPFNDVIRPVCLPTDDSDDYADYIGTVTGWGSTTDTTGDPSDVLRETSVIIDDPVTCSSYANSEPSYKICAGPTGGRGICRGDSGGPLMVVPNEGKMIQVGIVETTQPPPLPPATGPHECTQAQPQVYIRVSKFLNWIKETSKSGKCS